MKESNVANYGHRGAGKYATRHEIARKHLLVAAKRNTDIHDIKLSLNWYSAGDLVWPLAETRILRMATKLLPACEGSYLISE